MDQLRNPDPDILKENMFKRIPAGVSFWVDETYTYHDVEYNLKTHNYWPNVIGRPMSLAISGIQLNNMLSFSFAEGVVMWGFLKAIRIDMHDDFLQMIRNNDPRIVSGDIPIQQRTEMYYIGKTSYIWGSTAKCGSKTLFSHRNLVVGMDYDTRKPDVLNHDWSSKVLKYNQKRGIENARITFDKFDEHNKRVLYSFNVIGRGEYLDMNNHLNFKLHLLGFIVAIRSALTERRIPKYRGCSPDDVICRRMDLVFENESNVGDELCFKLYEGDDERYTLACYKGDVRVVYTHVTLCLVSATGLSSHI